MSPPEEAYESSEWALASSAKLAVLSASRVRICFASRSDATVIRLSFALRNFAALASPYFLTSSSGNEENFHATNENFRSVAAMAATNAFSREPVRMPVERSLKYRLVSSSSRRSSRVATRSAAGISL